LLFKAAGALYDLLQIALRLVPHRKKMVAEDHPSTPLLLSYCIKVDHLLQPIRPNPAVLIPLLKVK
jgi:hypothetical protein